jgi:hypothetical protein
MFLIPQEDLTKFISVDEPNLIFSNAIKLNQTERGKYDKL